MSRAIIPEKLINYSVYLDGSIWLGTADIVLPTIEYMTDSVKGAGILGEYESPIIGHTGSMTVTLNWRTPTREAIQLLAPGTHTLDFRGSIQVKNTSTGLTDSVGVKVTVKATPKSGAIGKFDVGTTTDTTNDLEVTYIKMSIDNKYVLEHDKLNFKHVVNGVDYTAKMRSQLGM